MEEANVPNQPSPKNKLSLSIDLRLIAILLLLIILVMLCVWRPWADTASAKGRTIEVTGMTTLTETPDEYSFSPMYEFSAGTKDAAIKQLSEKSAEVVAGLKNAGVADNKIKTSSSGYDNSSFTDSVVNKVTYTLQLTVSVDNEKLAQKVQDYLVTTTPSGDVSPSPTFSEAKRKQLESKARNLATLDARKKADQMAQNLGFKVGEVKSVSDNKSDSGPGIIHPLAMDTKMATSGAVQNTQIAVQPGQNEFSYSVSVVYYIH